jgi:hypothetical protein
MAEGAFLFSEFDMSSWLQRQETLLRSEIDGYQPDYLFGAAIDDLCEYLNDKYIQTPPVLHESEITTDQTEAYVSNIKGRAITFYLPFEGDEHLFKCRPTTRSLNPPRAGISDRQLVLSYGRTDHDAAAARRDFDRDLTVIKQHLEWLTRDVAPFNSSLRDKARRWIQSRRDRLHRDRAMVEEIGFPLRKRDNAPQTYAVPTVRRKPPIAGTQPGSSTHAREPILDLAEYEHILSVISNMVAVMERSPHAFKDMREEDLRQHFLVQLNGQYEGQATGETFNFEGKTDILIRAEGRNIFIAECKFWRGRESFHETVDQLLGYASWRDTKTAILVFNRERKLSSVLAKIPEIVEAHPNFLRQLDYKSETGFRFVLHNKDDKNRELTLTVLAFEVPA